MLFEEYTNNQTSNKSDLGNPVISTFLIGKNQFFISGPNTSLKLSIVLGFLKGF